MTNNADKIARVALVIGIGMLCVAVLMCSGCGIDRTQESKAQRVLTRETTETPLENGGKHTLTKEYETTESNTQTETRVEVSPPKGAGGFLSALTGPATGGVGAIALGAVGLWLNKRRKQRKQTADNSNKGQS